MRDLSLSACVSEIILSHTGHVPEMSYFKYLPYDSTSRVIHTCLFPQLLDVIFRVVRPPRPASIQACERLLAACVGLAWHCRCAEQRMDLYPCADSIRKVYKRHDVGLWETSSSCEHNQKAVGTALPPNLPTCRAKLNEQQHSLTIYNFFSSLLFFFFIEVVVSAVNAARAHRFGSTCTLH